MRAGAEAIPLTRKWTRQRPKAQPSLKLRRASKQSKWPFSLQIFNNNFHQLPRRFSPGGPGGISHSMLLYALAAEDCSLVESGMYRGIASPFRASHLVARNDDVLL
ncbi:MAG TPA: hypothetical protein VIQ51_03960 [Chryseosolibacter sp.]